MKKKRLLEIDIIKAIGIFGVIAIHVLTYNLTGPVSKFIWNYSQFVVIAFVFSSGYILPIAYKNSFSGLKSTLLWYKKRLARLLLPFYIYLFIHFALWIIFPQFFQGLGLKKSFDYFTQSALFIGGTNFNFLTLLFIQLSLLFPILLKISKSKLFTLIYLTIIGLVGFYFTFVGFPYSYYRAVMWIPWSFVLFFATWMITSKNHQIIIENAKLLISGCVFFLWFLILFFYFRLSGNSINFYDHKYPPDFYYIFYGLGITVLLLLFLQKKKFVNQSFLKMTDFISKNSYSLFLVHYILLDFFLKARESFVVFQSAAILYFSVLALSVLVVFSINSVIRLFKS